METLKTPVWPLTSALTPAVVSSRPQTARQHWCVCVCNCLWRGNDITDDFMFFPPLQAETAPSGNSAETKQPFPVSVFSSLSVHTRLHTSISRELVKRELRGFSSLMCALKQWWVKLSEISWKLWSFGFSKHREENTVVTLSGVTTSTDQRLLSIPSIQVSQFSSESVYKKGAEPRHDDEPITNKNWSLRLTKRNKLWSGGSEEIKNISNTAAGGKCLKLLAKSG